VEDDDRLIVDPIRGWDVMLAGVGRMGQTDHCRNIG
jgi:hypothetical protein